MTSPALDLRTLDVFHEAAGVFKPPPKTTVTQWAERKRMLSSESSSYVGMYRSEIAPYQVGMMNAVNVPGVEEIVYFTSAQIGKSLCLENIMGFFLDEDPCPMIYMWPTLEVAKGWSAETLTPLLRDTPALAEKVIEGSRKTGSAALFKTFPGGWLALIGAASPATHRRRRARVIFYEEVDDKNYEDGEEGDVVENVWARAKTFWNRLRVFASTCTFKGDSRIEARYENSNKQKFWVKCPHCGEAQVLEWERLIFPKNVSEEELDEENVVYACLCGVELHEWDKPGMLASGEWRAERPEITKIQGFWINELYSPFVKWHEMARTFRRALSKREDQNAQQSFWNLSLARTWEEKYEAIDREGLVRRCESYDGRLVPDGVTVLTAGVDVQEDRILCQVRGWGRGKETWSIAYERFNGDTSKQIGTKEFPSPWERLDEFLQRTFLHERGIELPIAAALIDSGYHADEVYSFTKQIELDRRIFACKGMSDFSHPPVKEFNRNNKAHVRMYPVGSSQIKRLIYQWLRIDTPGPGYWHFTHDHNDAEYFDELTCEKLVKEYERGYPKKYWKKPAGARNEAMDCNVYAYAALLSLAKDVDKMLAHLREQLQESARKLAEERKKKIDPRQMTLLDPTPEIAPPPVPEVVQTEEVSAQPAVEQEPAPRGRVRIRSSWV